MVKFPREEVRSSARRRSNWGRYWEKGGRNLKFVGCPLCVRIFACYLIPTITFYDRYYYLYFFEHLLYTRYCTRSLGYINEQILALGELTC